MSVLINQRDKEFISREMISGVEKITPAMVKKATSNHIVDHVDLTYEEICDRFRGVYKNGSNKRYTEKNSNIVSWFTDEEMFLSFCVSALNNEKIRGQVARWLRLWSKEDGNSYEIRLATKKANLGRFVTRRGSWKDASICSNMVIVLELESEGSKANAGFSIKTAYPVPTDDEWQAHQEKNRKGE